MNKPIPIDKSNFFLLTGGPGSGKTSVLLGLQKYGFQTVPEVARDIIQFQNTINGDAIHIRNRKAFLALMLDKSLADYHHTDFQTTPVIFDRGIPDLYGYAKAFCGGVTTEVTDAVQQCRYNLIAFIFPPWLDIYQNDLERQQDFQEAIDTYEALKTGYEYCSYCLIEVPKCNIDKRVKFIINQINQYQ